jgi:hypothetical protein
MAKLPFIVEPRLQPKEEIVGSEESGQLKVIRRGYLTTAEKTFVQQQVSDDDSTQVLVRLTRKVGASCKLDMQAAYELLTEVMQGTMTHKLAQKVFDNYSDEINEVLSAMTTIEERKKLVQAFCLLVYRVDPNINADSIMDLHPDLLDDLSRLYVDEENRSTVRLQGMMLSDEDNSEGSADALDALEKK